MRLDLELKKFEVMDEKYNNLEIELIKFKN